MTSDKRSPLVPEFPAVAESVAGYEAMQWFAILGPKDVPAAIVAHWNHEIDRVLHLDDTRHWMENQGLETAGGAPERFRDVLQREIPKWQQVASAAGIKPGRY